MAERDEYDGCLRWFKVLTTFNVSKGLNLTVRKVIDTGLLFDLSQCFGLFFFRDSSMFKNVKNNRRLLPLDFSHDKKEFSFFSN